METEFSSEKVKLQCTDTKVAGRLFGGDKILVVSLMARINALKSAETIMDIIRMPTIRFHKLRNKNGRNLEGCFAMDVKTSREPWRIILQPLTEERGSYLASNIDEIASKVKIVEIMEVSRHYE